MSDTQWPRYYVFKQDTPELKHQSCGTVHAPDPELALQIARDVFVRRPACHSLWVAAADEVLTDTGQDKAEEPIEAGKGDEDGEYLLFARPNQRDPHTYQRKIKAQSPQGALDVFHQEHPELARLGVWVVPQASVHASQSGEEEAWFKPAEDKPYRHGSFYHPDQLLRKIRTKDS